MRQPLEARRGALGEEDPAEARGTVRYLPPLGASPVRVLIESVKAQGLEGLVAKRRDSRYEAGLRSGAGRGCASTGGRSS